MDKNDLTYDSISLAIAKYLVTIFDPKLGIYFSKVYCNGYLEQKSTVWELKSELEKWPQIYERTGNPALPAPTVEEEDPYYKDVPIRDVLTGKITNKPKEKIEVLKEPWTELEPMTGISKTGEELIQNQIYKRPPPLTFRLLAIPGFGLNK